jgi:hypothetical protein
LRPELPVPRAGGCSQGQRSDPRSSRRPLMTSTLARGLSESHGPCRRRARTPAPDSDQCQRLRSIRPKDVRAFARETCHTLLRFRFRSPISSKGSCHPFRRYRAFHEGEAGAQRLRHHFRRPVPGRRDQLIYRRKNRSRDTPSSRPARVGWGQKGVHSARPM